MPLNKTPILYLDLSLAPSSDLPVIISGMQKQRVMPSIDSLFILKTISTLVFLFHQNTFISLNCSTAAITWTSREIHGVRQNS